MNDMMTTQAVYEAFIFFVWMCFALGGILIILEIIDKVNRDKHEKEKDEEDKNRFDYL